jgi:hypothetical protein
MVQLLLRYAPVQACCTKAETCIRADTVCVLCCHKHAVQPELAACALSTLQAARDDALVHLVAMLGSKDEAMKAAAKRAMQNVSNV